MRARAEYDYNAMRREYYRQEARGTHHQSVNSFLVKINYSFYTAFVM